MPVLEEQLRGTPYREDACGRLMAALYRCGRQSAALDAYRALARILGEDLGLTPGPELRRLESRVLAQDPAHDVPARPAAAGRPHNLPAPTGRFLGREAELAELEALLASERLVTLWGPGGAGKTRLSLEPAARAVPAYADGVWFVNLAKVDRAEVVVAAVRDALGMATGVDPDRLEEPCRYLTSRQMLVVLHNCEHLVSACAELRTPCRPAAPPYVSSPHCRRRSPSMTPVQRSGSRVDCGSSGPGRTRPRCAPGSGSSKPGGRPGRPRSAAAVEAPAGLGF